MAEIKGVPAIRFKGFSDEWNQDKLRNLCEEFQSGNFIKASDIKTLGDYPVYGGNGIRGYTDTYNHDGAFAIIGRQGALCGNMNISFGKAYFTEHAVAVNANQSSDTTFLFYLLGKMNLGQYSGQSAQPGLAVSKLTELLEYVPKQDEQTQIGSYFQHLDKLISLHHAKVNKLTNLKKAMLEKLFPKQGADMPEIRFKGFAGAWEVEDIGKLTQVIDPHPSHRAPDAVLQGVPFIGIGDISENGKLDLSSVRIVSEDIYLEHSRRYTLSEGDFAYGRVASIGKIIDLSKNVLSKYTYSPTMALIKPISVNSDYLKAYLGTESFKNLVDNKTTGSTRKSLGVEALRAMPVLLPTDKEQTKIGSYFQNLDKLITLHHTELEKLNNLKIACLEKMFV